ncbi:MAG: transposase [Candidatus Cloacimonetes bacterium]|nr:transposase [Candidatus Cloacimonadota bacterium]
MRCRREEFIEGAIFHFYNKTPQNKLLFQNDADYLYFLDKFKKNLQKYPCEVYAYCLMPNHFHFCLQQLSEVPIYRIFNDSFTSYALHFNSKYNWKGRLFQDKLQHKQLHTDNYLISLCQYIHYNPKKAGLVDNLSEWQFSNYLEFIKKRKGSLFSEHLRENFPDVFENYENLITDYERHREDKKFVDLLIDQ